MLRPHVIRIIHLQRAQTIRHYFVVELPRDQLHPNLVLVGEKGQNFLEDEDLPTDSAHSVDK